MTMIRRAVDTHHSLLQEEIQQQHEDVEKRSEQLLREIQGEIDELQRRQRELQHLGDSEDPPQVANEMNEADDYYLFNRKSSLSKTGFFLLFF